MLIGMFASQIGKDIMELMMDVNKLRDEVAVSYMLPFLFLDCCPFKEAKTNILA